MNYDEVKMKKTKHSWLTRVGIIVLMLTLTGLAAFSLPASDKTPLATPSLSVPLAEQVVLYDKASTYVYSWSIEMITRSTSKQLDPTSRAEIVAVKDNSANLSALVNVTKMANNPDGSQRLCLWLTNIHILHEDELGNQVEESDPDFLVEMERPVYFDQTSDGSIINFMAFDKEEENVVNMKRGIVSYFQNRLSGNTKTTTEIDVTGEYEPIYTITESTDKITILKSRTEKDYSQYVDDTIDTLATPEFEISDQSKAVFNTTTHIFESISQENHTYSVPEASRVVPDEGSCVWSEMLGKGQMTLNTIHGNPVPFPFSLENYVSSSIMAITAAEIPESLESIVLYDVLVELQKNPLSPDNYTNLLNALRGNNVRVSNLRVALNRNRITKDMMSAVLGALGEVGTPEAQQILVQDIILAPGMASQTVDQAMIALLAVKNPTLQTVDTLETISNQKSHAFSSQATLVLGAMVEKLIASNAPRANSIVKNLEQELSLAISDDDVRLYLDALGNTGISSTVSTIVPFLENSEPTIQCSALGALRKMPAELIMPYINNLLISEQNAVVRAIATEIVRASTPCFSLPNEEEAPMPTATTYSRNWTYWIGGGDVRGRFYAEFQADNNNSNLNLWAMGEARAYAWSWSQVLLKADILSNLVTINGQLQKHFRARLYVLNNLVYSYERNLTCGQTYTYNMGTYTRTFFNLSHTFYICGFPFNLSIGANGNVSGSCTFTYNACNAPITAQATASITPSAWVSAYGTVSVSLIVIKVGATLTVDLFRTSLPASVIGTLQTTAPVFRTCFSLQRVTNAISSRLSLWYRWRRWYGGWGSLHSWNVWSYTSSASTANIFNYCLPY